MHVWYTAAALRQSAPNGSSCVLHKYWCVAVVLRACERMSILYVNRKRSDNICSVQYLVGLCKDVSKKHVNRKRSDSIGSVQYLAVFNSPWSLSIAVLTLLLSMEVVDIRSSLEPWPTTREKMCKPCYCTCGN